LGIDELKRIWKETVTV